MAKVALFLIDGFEEVEAITVVDILRRGGVSVTIISLTENLLVRSKHGVLVQADALFDNFRQETFDMLVVPGGTIAYTEHEPFMRYIEKNAESGTRLAAICAAPAVFGKLGLLRGKRTVCYPGMEEWLDGAMIGTERVVTDGNITTSRGPGTAVLFALHLLALAKDKKTAQKIADDFLIEDYKETQS